MSITLGATTMAYCGDESLDPQTLQFLGSVAAGGPDGTGKLALETASGEQRMVFYERWIRLEMNHRSPRVE